MGNAVYAEKMGFFHKGSGGKGIAPLDVCLSPPPPPAGPVPVPYVNNLSASDLIKGSKSVKIHGNPTALENSSEIAMSTGNEAATPGLGAGVVTHKIKGKGTFKLWSFTVKAEGKGVDRHGDPMGQNEMSDPPNCVDAAALESFKAYLRNKGIADKKCPKYDGEKHRPEITEKQDDKVHGETCWECQGQMDAGEKPLTVGGKFLNSENEFKTRSGGKWKGRDREAMTPDHQPPLCVAWELGGCHIPEPPDGFKDYFSKPSRVKPHCRRHSNAQGSQAAAYSRRIRAARA
jgi:hypothetical protein